MVEIRGATAADAEGVRDVLTKAFPTSAEADLVEQLGRDGDVAISLVAVDAGQVVGHVLFSHMEVEGDGRKIKALGLGPVAVLPRWQAQGVGSRLIQAGLEQAAAMEAGLVFLLGEPEYYRRFGFDAATAAPFASPYAGRYFQAKVLATDLQLPSSGRADYARAFGALG